MVQGCQDTLTSPPIRIPKLGGTPSRLSVWTLPAPSCSFWGVSEQLTRPSFLQTLCHWLGIPCPLCVVKSFPPARLPFLYLPPHRDSSVFSHPCTVLLHSSNGVLLAQCLPRTRHLFNISLLFHFFFMTKNRSRRGVGRKPVVPTITFLSPIKFVGVILLVMFLSNLKKDETRPSQKG